MIAAMVCAALTTWCLVPSPARLRAVPEAVAQPRVPTSRLVVSGIVAVVIYLALPAPWGIGAAMGAFSLSVVGIGYLDDRPTRLRQRQMVAQLPATLHLIASGLEAGMPLRGACRHVSEFVPEPTKAMLSGVLAHVAIGRSDAQAWRAIERDEVWGDVAADIVRSCDSGARLAQILRTHAEEARAIAESSARERARSAGVRSVLPLMCCFLPAFILVGVVPIVASTITKMISPS